MSGPKAQRIRLAPPVRRALEVVARSTKAEYRKVVRAQIVLKAAVRTPNAQIADEVGCHVDTVRKWRARFAENSRVVSLEDAARSGRPSHVPVSARCEVVKMACDHPSKRKVKCRETWTHQAIADASYAEIGVKLSRSEVGRILRCADFRPHKFSNWLHSPDPEFRPKVRRICKLYTSPPKDATILCVDEKTSIQALERKYPTKTPVPGKQGKYEFEYIRHGTIQLFAALDIRTGRVYGQCRSRRKAKDLVAFMEYVARCVPSGQVYIVWDNLNIHYDGPDKRWIRFNERHGGRFHFVYTPLHASWVNQVEIWFSILQRRVIKYGNFLSVADLKSKLEKFITHWNRREAHPFRWTFRGRFQQDTPRCAA